MQRLIDNIVSEFKCRFDNDPILVKSPGRVNLIGEHTDYNNGFVLPAAIDKEIILALAPNEINKVRLVSVDMEESCEADLSDELKKSNIHWANYILGVVDQLQKNGYEVGGFDCVFGGNIPIGAGLSSSAALEGGVAFGLSRLFDLQLSKLDMAKLSQKAENEFVGVQCGIMDQFVSLNGKKHHAMKLDCRSLEYEFYTFRYKNVHIVLCDTQIRRELVSSEYNVRRSQCEEGVQVLREFDPAIKSLRDVSIDFLDLHRQKFDPIVYKRCKYVVDENQRVLAACEDLENKDLVAFGKQMYSSHEGLRDEYQVSCEELDVLVEEARKIEGVYGARMMGGGFGGCTINLVEEACLESFKKQISYRFRERTGKEMKFYQTKVSGGTHLAKASTPNSIKEA